MSSTRIQNLVRAIAAAAIVIIVAGDALLKPGADDVPAVLQYAGRLHILALHVPIGVLVLALCAEAATLLKKYRRTGDLIVGFALPLLVVTGLGAILLGLALGHGGDYPVKLVAKHRNLTSAGLIVAAIAMIAWPYRRRVGRWPHRSLLLGSAFFISVGAHFGGSLTHGADYLFEPITPKTKPVKDPVDTEVVKDTAPPASADAGVTDAGVTLVDASAPEDAGIVDASVPHDAAVAAPKPTGPKAVVGSIFARRCGPCHTSGSKGGLRLSTDPSKMKPVEVVAGDPGSSRIYERMTLPVDDEYHMPPEKQAQPSAAEVAAVRQWIDGLKASE